MKPCAFPTADKTYGCALGPCWVHTHTTKCTVLLACCSWNPLWAGFFIPSLPVWLSVGCQSCRKPRDCSTALLWCGKGESLGEDLCLGVSKTAQWAEMLACRPDDPSLILASHMVAGKKWLLFVVLWPPHFRICALGHIPGYLINTQIEARHIVHKFVPHLWWWRLKPRKKVWATEQRYDEQVLPRATSCLGYPYALPGTPPVSGKTFPYLWWCQWPMGLLLVTTLWIGIGCGK